MLVHILNPLMNSHRGETVAKIWIEENGEKKIEVEWSELSAKDEASILEIIDRNWDILNKMIDRVFAGEKKASGPVHIASPV